MSITAITIENFKGIKGPLRIEIKPITLLFGPNSAGKSTIIQALHFAREIFERDNLNPDWTIAGGDSVDLGYYHLEHFETFNKLGLGFNFLYLSFE
jgi:predicted ATPase